MSNNIENQYIELYTQTAHMIEHHSAGCLNAARQGAFEAFQRLGFPRLGDEAWQHTNLTEWFAKDYGMNLNRIDIPINPYHAFHCDVPNLSTQLCFLLNDRFYIKPEIASLLPEGVLLCSLKEAAKKHPQLLTNYAITAPYSQDGVVAFNTTFAQDGVFLYIPDGVIIEKPIQLVNILKSDVDLLVNRRLHIVVGKNAQARLLVCDHTFGEQHFLVSQVTEIIMNEGAVFDFYELEENSLNTKRLSSTHTTQAASSNLLINGITLHNGVTRNNTYSYLNGEGAELSLSGMSITDRNQMTDNYTQIIHNAPHCTTHELFKYVLNDESRGAFEGRILVQHNAQKTIAFQTNRNLLMTPSARMYTKPQLEIYADDVKCSHGATVGQLDEEALFYLRARGINEKEARTMLSYAFTSDILDLVRLPALRERLSILVEKRFRGELAKCAGCSLYPESESHSSPLPFPMR